MKNNNDSICQETSTVSLMCFIILETLRKYPPLPFLDRKCNTDYKIPGTDIVIEKDVSIYISLLGIHNDEKYYPEPEKFIPERFQNNENAAESVYVPFGSGPRSCIGKYCTNVKDSDIWRIGNADCELLWMASTLFSDNVFKENIKNFAFFSSKSIWNDEYEASIGAYSLQI